jgi:hypothetical protein
MVSSGGWHETLTAPSSPSDGDPLIRLCTNPVNQGRPLLLLGYGQPRVLA